jgi:predicted amidophosphoribosyltransferase
MDAPVPAQRSLVCAACLAALREPSWPRCARCHFPRGTGRAPSASCLECAGWPAALAAARTSAVLEPPADALVHALKYGGWRALAAPLGERMARICPPPAGALVVPVPTTPGRARARGYNQADLLARAYAGAANAPLLDALERTREGPSQVALAPDHRRLNVAGAFAVRAGARATLAGRVVALIDDVLTTGATAGAAAEALERAGTVGVTVITLARALPGREAAS